MRPGASRRDKDRGAGRPVFYPVRYTDDFLIFVSGSYQDAAAEKEAVADWLREEMGLMLSEQKSRVTELTKGFRFLGCLVRLKWDTGTVTGAGSRSHWPCRATILDRRAKKSWFDLSSDNSECYRCCAGFQLFT